jgi:hypothetical protein
VERGSEIERKSDMQRKRVRWVEIEGQIERERER